MKLIFFKNLIILIVHHAKDHLLKPVVLMLPDAVTTTLEPDWLNVTVTAANALELLNRRVDNKLKPARVFLTILVLKIMAFFIELVPIILKLTYSERIDISPTSEVPVGQSSRFWTGDTNPKQLKIDF